MLEQSLPPPPPVLPAELWFMARRSAILGRVVPRPFCRGSPHILLLPWHRCSSQGTVRRRRPSLRGSPHSLRLESQVQLLLEVPCVCCQQRRAALGFCIRYHGRRTHLHVAGRRQSICTQAPQFSAGTWIRARRLHGCRSECRQRDLEELLCKPATRVRATMGGQRLTRPKE